VALRLISRRLPRQLVVDVELAWRRTDREVESRVETVLDTVDHSRRAERFELIDGGERLNRKLRLKLGSERELKALAARLAEVEGLTGYTLSPRKD
jgi:hypothetical protein